MMGNFLRGEGGSLDSWGMEMMRAIPCQGKSKPSSESRLPKSAVDGSILLHSQLIMKCILGDMANMVS